MQKLTMEQIRDLEEGPALLEENAWIEEEYHISMLTRRQTAGYNDLSREASRALRAASPLTRAEFLNKWG